MTLHPPLPPPHPPHSSRFRVNAETIHQLLNITTSVYQNLEFSGIYTHFGDFFSTYISEIVIFETLRYKYLYIHTDQISLEMTEIN